MNAENKSASVKQMQERQAQQALLDFIDLAGENQLGKDTIELVVVEIIGNILPSIRDGSWK